MLFRGSVPARLAQIRQTTGQILINEAIWWRHEAIREGQRAGPKLGTRKRAELATGPWQKSSTRVYPKSKSAEPRNAPMAEHVVTRCCRVQWDLTSIRINAGETERGRVPRRPSGVETVGRDARFAIQVSRGRS